MGASRTIALAAALLSLAGCQSEPSAPPEQADPISSIQIELDVKAPAKSTGILRGADLNHSFHVGYGKYGIACEGSRFEEGVTPLGTFRVNAVLSDDIFEMDPALIEQSGRTRDDLKSTLFRSMSAIDFKGDGETGEYGSGYISLRRSRPRRSPSNSTSTPVSSAGTASPSMAPTTNAVSATRSQEAA